MGERSRTVGRAPALIEEPSLGELGQSLGRIAPPGAVVALVGDLGTGKTVFARGVAAGLGISGPITSPTFVLLALYTGGRLDLAHVDLYRLGDPDEVFALGLHDYLGREAVTVVEWADRFPELLPPDHLEIRLRWVPGRPQVREITVGATGDQHRQLARALVATLAG